MAELCKVSRQILSLRSSSRLWFPGFKNPLRAYLSEDARQAAAVYRKSSWRVFVAVSLERRPTITKEKTSLEKKFEIFQNSLEIEHSALSDYEFKRNQNKKGAQTTGKKKLTEADEQKRLEFERDFARIEDEEEEIKTVLKNLVFTDRLTEADKSNDTKSLDRKLDESLHLVTKCSDHWLLPETELVEGENLRQAAERLLREQCKAEVPVLFLSNAPSGVHTIELSSSEKKTAGNQGKKIFFYKAMLQNTKELPDVDLDFKWLTMQEMQKVIPNSYFRQIVRFAS